MKNFNDIYPSSEGYEFRPFSERELAIVVGGGSDEYDLDFLNQSSIPEDEEDILDE